ncbi:hypothetical protein KCTC52924_00765 [Arenibacter antarcticus]
MESLSSVIVVLEIHPVDLNNFNLSPNSHWDTTQHYKDRKGFIINPFCSILFLRINNSLSYKC